MPAFGFLSHANFRDSESIISSVLARRPEVIYTGKRKGIRMRLAQAIQTEVVRYIK